MKVSDLKGEIQVVSGGATAPQQQPFSIQGGNEAPPESLNPNVEALKGNVKGALSTLKGISDIGQGVARAVTRPFIGDKAADSGLAGQESLNRFTQPTNKYQNFGFNVEQAAEFLIPAAKAAQAERALDVLTRGAKIAPVLGAGARILGKAAIQGAAATGVKLAQTGGDIKQSLKTGAIAGGMRGGFAVIGEGARAFRLPERLYSTIFKNSNADMMAELKSGGLQAMQQKFPQQYQDLVTKGIIKVGRDGSPIINDTLAEQAIDRGLRGSIRTMANEVVYKSLRAEDDLQTIVKNYTKPIPLQEPQYLKVLKTIQTEYDDVGFGEISDEAKRLSDALTKSKGLVSAEDALSLRRFFDRMRLASSFDKPASKLSMTQANFKTLADAVRSKVNDVPGIAPIMKDYSFYIDALEALAGEAKRRGNNQVIGLIDAIFLGNAVSNPVSGGILALLRRTLLTGWGSTAAGQAMMKSAASPAFSGAIGASASGLSEISQQSPQTMLPNLR